MAKVAPPSYMHAVYEPPPPYTPTPQDVPVLPTSPLDVRVLPTSPLGVPVLPTSPLGVPVLPTSPLGVPATVPVTPSAPPLSSNPCVRCNTLISTRWRLDCDHQLCLQCLADLMVDSSMPESDEDLKCPGCYSTIASGGKISTEENNKPKRKSSKVKKFFNKFI